MDLPTLLTIREVQELLKLSRGGVYNLIDSGEITRVRLSPKAVRIDGASIAAYIARNTDTIALPA